MSATLRYRRSITLHEGDYGSRRRSWRCASTGRFRSTSDLKFAVDERPTIGSVRVLDRPGDDAELVHLAAIAPPRKTG